MYKFISLDEATNLVAAVGALRTCLVTGPMGCGKSSMLKALAERFPDHHPVYLEAQLLDLGDLQMPRFDAEVVRFVPNAALGVHLKKPIILMIDEIGKASKAVMNALLRVMLERKIGEHSLPEGSIVFATTNRGSEGLGDNIPAHARNRMSQINIGKPTAMQWVENWAIKHGVHPIVIATAMEYPHMFADDADVENPNDNHYIFHPKQPRLAFVTPRSLEMASDVIHAADRCNMDQNTLTHALIGLVGEAAAMDMLTIKKLDDALPSWERVINDPENCSLPKGGVASVIMATKALGRVDRASLNAWMTYLQRLPAEVIALFVRNAVRISDSEKRGMFITSKAFTDLSVSKLYLFQ